MLASMMVTLNGCSSGFEKGEGISAFDTDSEDKADKKWFDKFYGEKNDACDDSFWTTKPFCTSGD